MLVEIDKSQQTVAVSRSAVGTSWLGPRKQFVIPMGRAARLAKARICFGNGQPELLWYAYDQEPFGVNQDAGDRELGIDRERCLAGRGASSRPAMRVREVI